MFIDSTPDLHADTHAPREYVYCKLPNDMVGVSGVTADFDI